MNGDIRGQESRTSFEDHVTLSGKLPFPVADGSHILAQDVQEALGLIAARKTVNVSDVWRGLMAKLESRAWQLLPELRGIRGESEIRSS